MKLSKETLEILQNFATINQSMQFRKGKVQTTVSNSKNIIGIADIAEDIPQDFAIYDLNKFLGAISLIADPEIELADNYAVVRGTGKQTIKWRYCEPRMITSWPADKKIPELSTADSQLEVTKETFLKLSKAVSLISVENISIDSKDGEVQLKTLNSDDPDSSTASFNVGSSDKTYTFNFKWDAIKILQGDYLVEISKNRMTSWTNKDKPIRYFIPAEATSKFV